MTHLLRTGRTASAHQPAQGLRARRPVRQPGQPRTHTDLHLPALGECQPVACATSLFKALLGANGAGKTTTLRAISGLLSPTSGDIIYRGKRRPDLIVRDGIAHSPEERHIWPELSVRENLNLGAYSCPDKVQTEQRLESVLQRFPRLRERMSQLAGLLSGGEQQMLAIGRALMSAPKLLLLDEPSLGLSPLMSQEVLGALRDLCELGITILIVEQNVYSALSVASRAYVFEIGRIVAEKDAASILRDPDVLRAYLGA